jgi:PilZ domain
MPEPIDRRAAERMPVNADTSCAFVSPVIEDFGPAKIKNVSMDGLGILLSRRAEVGALLTVTFSNAARNFTRTVLVRVAHVTAEGGGFLVGGTFNTPLTYEEFTALVM